MWILQRIHMHMMDYTVHLINIDIKFKYTLIQVSFFFWKKEGMLYKKKLIETWKIKWYNESDWIRIKETHVKNDLHVRIVKFNIYNVIFNLQ